MKTKKRVISMALSLVMLIGMIMPVSASAVFTDVDEGAWYYNAVMEAYNKGYLAGTASDKFSPNDPMTRAMFVQLLSNYTEDYDSAAYANKSRFADVDSTAWYAASVEWAAEYSIVAGTSATAFSPNQNLTRQEMVTMLFNYAKITGNDISYSSAKLDTFADRSSVASWAVEPMAWATDKGIISGTSDTMLSPQNQTTRAQVASMIINAENILVSRSLSGGTETDPGTNLDNNATDPDNTNSNNGNNGLVTDEKAYRLTGHSEVDADGGYYDYDYANAVMDLINELRVENGLNELAYSLKVQD